MTQDGIDPGQVGAILSNRTERVIGFAKHREGENH